MHTFSGAYQQARQAPRGGDVRRDEKGGCSPPCSFCSLVLFSPVAVYGVGVFPSFYFCTTAVVACKNKIKIVVFDIKLWVWACSSSAVVVHMPKKKREP